MMRISCPQCGLRDHIEFTWGGQADIVRPACPEACSDQEWSEYLFTKSNPKGIHLERWCHTYGCGQWFIFSRDTVTHRAEPSADPGLRQEPVR